MSPATRGACIGAPISWLRLERYRLGELSGAERHRVALHLSACAACAACAARIDADEVLELPPMPAVAVDARPAKERARRAWRGLGATAGVLALAAAALLGVGQAWRGGPVATGGAQRGSSARTKGDAMGFVLVREDGERTDAAGGVFRDGDRFEAVVTCPPSMRGAFDLAVFDAAGASFPMASARSVACGNDVRLPGAFRLTGAEPETVCLLWTDDGAIDRGAVTLAGALASPRALCVELRPVTSR